MANDAMDVPSKAGGEWGSGGSSYFCVCALCVWMGSMCVKNPICLSVEVPKIYRY